MVMEESPSKMEEITGPNPVDHKELVPVDKELPVPEGISEEESQALKHRAEDVVRQLEESGGSREMELVTSIGSVGIQVQRNAASELELLRHRVGDVLTREGPAGEVSKDLVGLRVALDQINPHQVARQGLLRKVFGMLPVVGRSLPAIKVVERIALRYEPVGEQVTVIETRLREGQTMLVRDNVELKKLYEQAVAVLQPVQKNAYLGELLMHHLEELMERSDDPLKCERVRNALHDVSMRVQDLRTMEQVNVQFFVSIEMTRQNNARLGQSVERTLALGTNVVMVALAIQTALARQKRVLEATQRTREFLGNLIVANADSIKQHTVEIGDVYNQPVIALEKITQAHTDLIEAMNTADRLKQEGIYSARENIARLRELSSDLVERSRGLREQRDMGPRSIEA